MKEAFEYKRLAGKVLTMIDQANAIMEEYAAMGITMTLRMLHYQFVSRLLFANTLKNYKRLGHALKVGRRMGLVDWKYLEDSIRSLDEHPTWTDPQDALSTIAGWYQEDIWSEQEYAPELWIEKYALGVVLNPTCRELRTPLFACRGYVSASAQYDASKRFQQHIADGRTPIVFYLGDHDPSGLDMTRDNREVIELLTGEAIEVRRLGLNWDQIEQYNPPPNPAKMRDSRYGGYVRRFGRECWELDALPPNVLIDLVTNAIRPLIDTHIWQASLDREAANRDKLELIRDRYAEIIEQLERRE